jgi:hypothetical protein
MVGAGGTIGAGGSPPTGGAGGAPTEDSWEGWAKDFFVEYCTACHDDDHKGTMARDYHVLSNVMREKAEIACGVAKSNEDWTKRGCKGFPPAGQFPIGTKKPTDAERDRLLRWIDAGTP